MKKKILIGVLLVGGVIALIIGAKKMDERSAEAGAEPAQSGAVVANRVEQLKADLEAALQQIKDAKTRQELDAAADVMAKALEGVGLLSMEERQANQEWNDDFLRRAKAAISERAQALTGEDVNMWGVSSPDGANSVAGQSGGIMP